MTNDFLLTRRRFLARTSLGLGTAALAGLLEPPVLAEGAEGPAASLPHFAPKAKRVIYLFMSGGPSQMDTLDPKPLLAKRHGEDMPASVRGTQRTTLMTRGQAKFAVASSPFKFRRFGDSGHQIVEHLPNIGRIADEICVVRSMHTEPINHDPAVNMIQTGAARAGRPCIGSWISWGLGSEKKNLPDFVVLLSGGGGQPVLSRYYHSGFLPSRHQGVQFQSKGDPVLFLSNPPGIDHETRGELVDGINQLNRLKHAAVGDPEIEARISAFELAYRMQSSVPGLMDVSREPRSVLDRYGASPGNISFANNCLLARRLVEQGVRFVQLYHRDWDHHGGLTAGIPAQCKQVDQASAALIEDLKERGLLKDTLVIWGGEFGRTTFSQGDSGSANFGRDHHPRCFSIWMAGGGIKPGLMYGKTDDFGYNVVENGVHVHDFQATVLHLLGVDHERLTYSFQGRHQRLTDIGGQVVKGLLA